MPLDLLGYLENIGPHRGPRKPYTKSDCDIISLALDAMRLPVPACGEFFSSKDSLFVFLTRYGLALKFMDEQEYINIKTTKSSDLALQPLKLIKLDKGAFALTQGIKLTKYDCSAGNMATEDLPYLQFLQQESEGCPFELWDMAYNNIGLLPALCLIEGQNRPFPTVLDYGSIRPKDIANDNAVSLSQKFGQAAYCGIQQRVFAPVTERLMDAWPDDGPPSVQGMAKFFDYCAAIVRKPENDPGRLLVPGWTQEEGAVPTTKRANKTAKLYEQTLCRCQNLMPA